MTEIIEFDKKVKYLIDDLKGVFNSYGLGGTGYEYKIMSETFTYKLLNDKLLKELKHSYNYEQWIKENPELIEKGIKENKSKVSLFIESISDEEYNEEFLDELNVDIAKMNKKHFLVNIYDQKNSDNIHEIFDNTLKEISDLNKRIFSIATSGRERKKLFEPISKYVVDSSKRAPFVRAIIERLADISFEEMFDRNFDFFSSIFEYLIKDYNTDSGRYAEFYSPASCGHILARIMVKDDEDVRDVQINDPSSGSGMLLMTLANRIGIKDENGNQRCSLYAQDISQKSSDFLRLNLILNGMTESLKNVIQGNTLTEPSHKDDLDSSKLRKFEYITANPPFKVDFSDSVDILENDKNVYNRFFAGIPAVPKNKKDSMPIYLMFIQHILATLKDNGKACIIVPSGFCTDSSKIALNIRKMLVDNNYLEGVIQMPSNIFSNTGTNVSIISINKAKENNKVILIDASSLGQKEKFDNGQRTVLSEKDEYLIVNTYHEKSNLDNFSKSVSVDEIKENGYQINAGRYFDVKFEELLSGEDLDNKINELVDLIKDSFIKSSELQENVLKQFGGISNE